MDFAVNAFIKLSANLKTNTTCIACTCTCISTVLLIIQLSLQLQIFNLFNCLPGKGCLKKFLRVRESEVQVLEIASLGKVIISKVTDYKRYSPLSVSKENL